MYNMKMILLAAASVLIGLLAVPFIIVHKVNMLVLKMFAALLTKISHKATLLHLGKLVEELSKVEV